MTISINKKTEIMTNLNEILKSKTGSKMVASLVFSNDMDKSTLKECNWISELPLAQQELFDTIYSALSLTRVDLAFRLINNKPLK